MKEILKLVRLITNDQVAIVNTAELEIIIGPHRLH